MNNIKSRIAAVFMLVSFILPMYSQSVSMILSEQDSLIDNVTAQISEMKNRILTLSLQVSNDAESNKKLLEEISSAEAEMASMKENIASLKAALVSNKEDTSNMIELFSDALSQISSLEADLQTLKDTISRKDAQIRNANIFFNIAVPITGLVGTIPCIMLMADGDKNGYYMLAADLGVTLTLELTWNIGRGIEATIPKVVLW